MSSTSRKNRWGVLASAWSISLLVLLAINGPIARVAGEAPVADFTTSSTFIMVGQSIQFTYTGTQGAGIVSYTWNPGDGTGTLTEESPIHRYNTPGQYSISLTVVDADGFSSTITKNALLIVQQFPYRPFPEEEEEDNSGLFAFLFAGLVVSVGAGVVATIASMVISYRERRRLARSRPGQVPERPPVAKQGPAIIQSNADALVHDA